MGNGFDPRLPLGLIASIRGDYAETARLGEDVLQESQSRREIWNEQFSYYLLTRAAILQGDFDSANGYGQRTYQLAKKNQDQWFMAYCLNELGTVALALGDYTAARGHFQASFKLREAFDDPEGMAVALNYLGGVELKESNFAKARNYFLQSRDIYRAIYDRGGLATALNGLAKVALAEGELIEARHHFLEALQISHEIGYLSLITAILTGIAQLLLDAGEVRDVAYLLGLVENHPASEGETVQLARMIAQEQHLEIIASGGEVMELEGYVEHLLVWLPALNIANAPPTTLPTPPQALVEPLTGRELEVLRHIAGGLTNQQIAEALIISPGTAKWYTSQIYSKLGVKKRTQAVAKARELGLIS